MTTVFCPLENPDITSVACWRKRNTRARACQALCRRLARAHRCRHSCIPMICWKACRALLRTADVSWVWMLASSAATM